MLIGTSADCDTPPPNWVHAQLGTSSESEIQGVLDGLNVSMWYRRGEHLGPDVSGLSMEMDERENP